MRGDKKFFSIFFFFKDVDLTPKWRLEYSKPLPTPTRRPQLQRSQAFLLLPLLHQPRTLLKTKKNPLHQLSPNQPTQPLKKAPFPCHFLPKNPTRKPTHPPWPTSTLAVCQTRRCCVGPALCEIHPLTDTPILTFRSMCWKTQGHEPELI